MTGDAWLDEVPERARFDAFGRIVEELLPTLDEGRVSRHNLGLTDREASALYLHAIEWLSHRDIGARMGIAHSTAERHIANAAQKIGLSTGEVRRTLYAAWALDLARLHAKGVSSG